MSAILNSSNATVGPETTGKLGQHLLLIGDALLPCLDGPLPQRQVEVLEGIGSLDAQLLTLCCCQSPCLKGIHQLPASLPPESHTAIWMPLSQCYCRSRKSF
jgi:hypothetical protein